MDKTIKRHLEHRGIIFANHADEISFSERNSDFFKWFKEEVMGFDSEDYKREFYREAFRNGHTIGPIPHTLDEYFREKRARSEVILANLLVMGVLLGGAFAIWLIRRKIESHIHRLRRPSYYEAERARRLNLANERRRIRRRHTNNPCPTALQLKEAFKHARESVENMILLGSLMEDLECYIDNSLIFGEHGQIIARKGGIKRYLQSEIPDLYDSYKTLMRYKAISKKFRQVIGIKDPLSAATVLPNKKDATIHTSKKAIQTTKKAKMETRKEKNDREKRNENTLRTDSQGRDDNEVRLIYGNQGNGVSPKEHGDSEENNIHKSVNDLLEICEGTFINLYAILELRIGKDAIPNNSKSSYRSCSSTKNRRWRTPLIRRL